MFVCTEFVVLNLKELKTINRRYSENHRCSLAVRRHIIPLNGDRVAMQWYTKSNYYIGNDIRDGAM